MTLIKSGRCIILAFPGRTPIGMCQIYRYDVLLTTCFGTVLQGIRCVSCTVVFDRILSHDTFCPIDSKPSLVSQSSPLTSSRDREGLSIPSVCPGFFPFSGPYSLWPGFEYFANPQSRSDGYITWQMDNTPTIRMGAGAVGPDQGADGSGVDQRLISEEPMV